MEPTTTTEPTNPKKPWHTPHCTKKTWQTPQVSAISFGDTRGGGVSGAESMNSGPNS